MGIVKRTLTAFLGTGKAKPQPQAADQSKQEPESEWNLWMKKRFSEPIEDRRARNQAALLGRGLSDW